MADSVKGSQFKDYEKRNTKRNSFCIVLLIHLQIFIPFIEKVNIDSMKNTVIIQV